MRKSVELVLRGGLGNQLFQYFYAARIANSLDRPLIIDATSTLSSRARPPDLLEFSPEAYVRRNRLPTGDSSVSEAVSRGRRFIRIATGRIIGSTSVSRPVDIDDVAMPLDIRRKLFLYGYYQSARSVEEAERAGVRLTWPDGRHALAPGEDEMAASTAPVAVHVRLGDYRALPHLGTLPSNYYDRAIALLRMRGIEGPIWLFSDEPELAAQLIPGVDRVVRLGSPIAELRLMTKCHAHIISNSTFAWWGAWWSTNQGPVVAPWPWFRDSPPPATLIPDEWTTLDPWHDDRAQAG